MANIYWNEERHQWRCDIQIDGIRKSFTSKKEGNAGKRAVKMKVDAFIGNTSYADRSLEKEWERFLSDVAARSSASNLRNIQQIGRLYILPKSERRRCRPFEYLTFSMLLTHPSSRMELCSQRRCIRISEAHCPRFFTSQD